MMTDIIADIRTIAAVMSFISLAKGCILGSKISTTLSTTVLISSVTRTRVVKNIITTSSHLSTPRKAQKNKIATAKNSSILKLRSFLMTYFKPRKAYWTLFLKLLIFILLFSSIFILFFRNSEDFDLSFEAVNFY